MLLMEINPRSVTGASAVLTAVPFSSSMNLYILFVSFLVLFGCGVTFFLRLLFDHCSVLQSIQNPTWSGYDLLSFFQSARDLNIGFTGNSGFNRHKLGLLSIQDKYPLNRLR